MPGRSASKTSRAGLAPPSLGQEGLVAKRRDDGVSARRAEAGRRHLDRLGDVEVNDSARSANELRQDGRCQKTAHVAHHDARLFTIGRDHPSPRHRLLGPRCPRHAEAGDVDSDQRHDEALARSLAADELHALAEGDGWHPSSSGAFAIGWPMVYWLEVGLMRPVSPHTAMIGVDTGISFASFLRFWAVAARRNSSRAPQGPRSRNRSNRPKADIDPRYHRHTLLFG